MVRKEKQKKSLFTFSFCILWLKERQTHTTLELEEPRTFVPLHTVAHDTYGLYLTNILDSNILWIDILLTNLID